METAINPKSRITIETWLRLNGVKSRWVFRVLRGYKKLPEQRLAITPERSHPAAIRSCRPADALQEVALGRSLNGDMILFKPDGFGHRSQHVAKSFPTEKI